MRTEMIYPEWVQEQRTRGTTVKKIGGTYYLYLHRNYYSGWNRGEQKEKTCHNFC